MILSGKKLVAYKLGRIAEMVAMIAVVAVVTFILMFIAIYA